MPEINEEGQEKLLNSKVAIIGAGGLGCPVGLYLAGAGIGSITIIDNDHIEISNLNRQIAFSTHDIGLAKSKCLEKAIKKINPDIKTKSLNARLNSKNIQTSIHYTPCYAHQFYKNKFNIKHLIATKKIFNNVLSLPIHNRLSFSNIDFISDKVLKFFKGNI